MTRLATLTWHDGYRHVIGHNWGGTYASVRHYLDMSDDALHNATIIRLPRRFVQDHAGRIYRSEYDRQESVLARLRGQYEQDRMV